MQCPHWLRLPSLFLSLKGRVFVLVTKNEKKSKHVTTVLDSCHVNGQSKICRSNQILHLMAERREILHICKNHHNRRWKSIRRHITFYVPTKHTTLCPVFKLLSQTLIAPVDHTSVAKNLHSLPWFHKIAATGRLRLCLLQGVALVNPSWSTYQVKSTIHYYSR